MLISLDRTWDWSRSKREKFSIEMRYTYAKCLIFDLVSFKISFFEMLKHIRWVLTPNAKVMATKTPTICFAITYNGIIKSLYGRINDQYGRAGVKFMRYD